MSRTNKLSKGPPIYYEVSAVVSHKEVKTDTDLWQINLELESKVVKTQYRKILKQYAQKIYCELGPSFPSVEVVYLFCNFYHSLFVTSWFSFFYHYKFHGIFRVTSLIFILHSTIFQIVNTIDFEVPPLNFTFVRDRFAGKGVHISDDSLIGMICSKTLVQNSLEEIVF
eukprot:sb/3472310/